MGPALKHIMTLKTITIIQQNGISSRLRQLIKYTSPTLYPDVAPVAGEKRVQIYPYSVNQKKKKEPNEGVSIPIKIVKHKIIEVQNVYRILVQLLAFFFFYSNQSFYIYQRLKFDEDLPSCRGVQE